LIRRERLPHHVSQLATLTFSGGRLSDDTAALVLKVPA
jgi:hypothetical protein